VTEVSDLVAFEFEHEVPPEICASDYNAGSRRWSASC
jgi:hypothetical protein